MPFKKDRESAVWKAEIEREAEIDNEERERRKTEEEERQRKLAVVVELSKEERARLGQLQHEALELLDKSNLDLKLIKYNFERIGRRKFLKKIKREKEPPQLKILSETGWIRVYDSLKEILDEEWREVEISSIRVAPLYKSKSGEYAYLCRKIVREVGYGGCGGYIKGKPKVVKTEYGLESRCLVCGGCV